jgi:hypothetical protein
VLRTALTSRPSASGRFDSPSWLDKPLAAIPGDQPLSSGLRLADFSGGTTPSLKARGKMKKGMALDFYQETAKPVFL